MPTTATSAAAVASAAPVLYLWLNCEGWVRFGPFRHLRWGKAPAGQASELLDEANHVIAIEDRACGCWRSTAPHYAGSGGSGWAFRDPIITASPHPPHPRRR